MARRRDHQPLRVERTRTSSTWVAIGAAIVFLVLLVVFIAQNNRKVPLHFLGRIGTGVRSARAARRRGRRARSGARGRRGPDRAAPARRPTPQPGGGGQPGRRLIQRVRRRWAKRSPYSPRTRPSTQVHSHHEASWRCRSARKKTARTTSAIAHSTVPTTAARISSRGGAGGGSCGGAHERSLRVDQSPAGRQPDDDPFVPCGRRRHRSSSAAAIRPSTLGGPARSISRTSRPLATLL